MLNKYGGINLKFMSPLSKRITELTVLLFLTLFMWILPLTIISAIYSFMHQITMREASLELMTGNVLAVWSVWLLAALVISWFITYGDD